MQNSVNTEGKVVEFTSKSASEVVRGSSVPNEFSAVPKLNLQQETPKSAFISPLKVKSIFVVKKDGTKEVFDNKKIVNAVKNPSIIHLTGP